MKKYEALIKEHEQNVADVEALRKENEQLRAEITKTESNLNGIARSGDVDSYLQAKNQIDRCKAQIEVNVAIIEAKNEPIPVEEACAAWEEYYADADKTRQKEYAALMKLMDGVVLEQFKKVTNINLAMLQKKEAIRKAAGLSQDGYFGFFTLPKYEVGSIGKFFTLRSTGGRNPSLSENNAYLDMEKVNQMTGAQYAYLADKKPF